MKNLFKILLFITIIISSCSKKELIKLPITTSSTDALEYFERAMLSYQVGDGPECNADLDSALALDPEFAMALEFYESQNPRENMEREEKAKSLFPKISLIAAKLILQFACSIDSSCEIPVCIEK